MRAKRRKSNTLQHIYRIMKANKQDKQEIAAIERELYPDKRHIRTAVINGYPGEQNN